MWKKFADDAVDELRRIQREVNAVSFGHSPGGLKEIPIKLRESTAAMREFAYNSQTYMGLAYSAANGMNSPTYSKPYVPKNTQTSQQMNVTIKQGDMHVKVEPFTHASIVREQLMPEINRQFSVNQDQMTTELNRHLAKHKRA